MALDNASNVGPNFDAAKKEVSPLNDGIVRAIQAERGNGVVGVAVHAESDGGVIVETPAVDCS